MVLELSLSFLGTTDGVLIFGFGFGEMLGF